MANTLDGLAANVVTVIQALSVGFTVNATSYTSTVKGYSWAPRDLDKIPAAVVEMPEVERVDVDTPESQLGSFDWRVTFPVVFYFELDEAARGQAQAVNVVEAFIKAIDASPTMGDNAIIDSKVVHAGPPEIIDDEARALIRYPCELRILKEI